MLRRRPGTAKSVSPCNGPGSALHRSQELTLHRVRDTGTSMPAITIPNTATYRLANARVPVCLVADPSQLKPGADGLAPCDIVIDNARIAAIGPAGTATNDLPSVDL